MNKTEAALKALIIERYGSLKKFCEKIEMPWNTLDSILKRGILNSNMGNVLKITKELMIDIESLSNGEIVTAVSLQQHTDTGVSVPLNINELTEEELKDVACYIDFIISRR